MDEQFLITGCGRSGTLYVYRQLRAAGLRVNHEWRTRRRRPYGIVSWWHAVNADQFGAVVHQVRHPLVCIASCLTIRWHTWRWIGQHVPMPTRFNALRRAMKYWVRWNRICEGVASWRYKIEELETAWPELCERIGHPGLPYNPGLPIRHHREHPVVTWADVKEESRTLYCLIRRMADRYGYEAEIVCRG